MAPRGPYTLVELSSATNTERVRANKGQVRQDKELVSGYFNLAASGNLVLTPTSVGLC